jgi:pimeloyl-ACP methyl ester carboxylesterase
MPDKTLLIPGTQATSLADSEGRVVYNAVRVSLGLQEDDLGGRPPEEWERLLSLDQPEGDWKPARTSMEPGTTIVPHEVVGTPYDRLFSLAEPWPYDWRMDIRYNAQLLLEYMRANKPERGRFNLVGHSQGGLVIVAASKLTFDINEFSRLVARVVLVGSPLAGTMRAAEALLWGSGSLGEGNEVAARGMALTWPALHQMLPTWRAVVRPDGSPEDDHRQLLQRDGWPGKPGEGMRVDMLRRARETAALLAGPFARLGSGTMAMVVMGKRQMTPVEVVRDGDTLPDRADYHRNQQGDGLVPYRATLAWGGSIFGEGVVALSGKSERHAFLCNDPDVLDLTRGFLRAEAPPPPEIPPVRAPDSSFLGVRPSPLDLTLPEPDEGTASAAVEGPM